MANANVKRVKSSEIEFKDRLVSIQRVTKVTKGGRTFSFSAIVVVGNENGVVGHGLGKAKEVTAAISKGIDDAKKNLIKVPVLMEPFLMNRPAHTAALRFISNLPPPEPV